MKLRRCSTFSAAALGLAALLWGCASQQREAAPAAARGARPVSECAALAQRFRFPETRLTQVRALTAAAQDEGVVGDVPEHCLVSGVMNERTSPVDGKRYAIAFEMRLPTAWNGRFLYQANAGLGGVVAPAWGDTLGGGPRSNGVQLGYAVLSSDGGHALERFVPLIGAALFGLDPQARLDYGYQAVAKLAPMAQALLASYYGKRADRSYLVGSADGARQGVVAAARNTGAFDGILALAPGWRAPRAALAQVFSAQQFAPLAQRDARTGKRDLKTAFTADDMAAVSAAVLARCDALDGLEDGIVADTVACQRVFQPQRDLPVCAKGEPHAGCLSATQKAALVAVFAGPRLADGRAVYAPLAWDAGLRGADWRAWKLEDSVGASDAAALAFVFSTPPATPNEVNGQGGALLDFALGLKLERGLALTQERDSPYGESAMDFMLPPQPQRMSAFVERGGKLVVAHGVADPVSSALDSVAWFEAFRTEHGPAADASVRLYLVPGMNHGRGGVATDQFDLLAPLVAWVEQGVAPQAVVAAARGPGSNLPNPELPQTWSAQRTRLLCPFPQIGRYSGQGDSESAASFRCVSPQVAKP